MPSQRKITCRELNKDKHPDKDYNNIPSSIEASVDRDFGRASVECAGTRTKLFGSTLVIAGDSNETGDAAGGDEEEEEMEHSPSVEQAKDCVHNISIEVDNLSPKKKQALLEKHRDESLYQYHTAWNKLKSVDGILIPGGFGDPHCLDRPLSRRTYMVWAKWRYLLSK